MSAVSHGESTHEQSSQLEPEPKGVVFPQSAITGSIGAQNAVETDPKQPKKPEGPKKRAVPGIVRGPLIAEIVESGNGWLMFATNESAAVTDQLANLKSEILVPPNGLRSFIEARSLQLPSKAERGITAEELIGENMVFIHSWADMPDEWLEPIAHYVLMTWVYDRFNAIPYLRFLGEYGTGKTRMLQVAGALCYRSLAVSGNITGAALFRSIDLIRGTLAIDEADFKSSAEWSDITKILNNGYTPGLPVVRCDGSGTFQPQAYFVYGPKIISTRHRFDDPATESRCLTFETQECKVDPRIPLQLPPVFYDEARAIRNKLLGWRFDNFERIEADDSMLRNLDPRIAQVGASLLAVASDKGAVASFLNRYAESAKEDSPKEIVRQILAEPKGRISIAELTETANERLKGSGLSNITEKAVGGIVRSLGYRTKRRNTGYVVLKRGEL
jgi:hypothetical protein